MLKQGIHLKLGQSLSMTPQLQQAIKMLQLSSLELEQEIQSVLETNPLLERADEVDQYDSGQAQEEVTRSDEPLSETIPEELSTDSNWEDTYDTEWKTSNPDSESASDYIEKLHSHSEGLTEHLLWQIDLSNLSVIDKTIAHLVVDYINDDGLLTESPEQILDALESELLIEQDDVEAVIRFVQHLDPIGIGARDLGQSLWLQFNFHYPDHPLKKKAQLLLEKNLDLLAKRDYKSIKKEIRLNNDQLDTLVNLMKTLDPNPASQFNRDDVDYIRPDVYVRKVKGRWQVSQNAETVSELCINQEYAEMASDKHVDKAATEYIKNNLQQARWFIKSLENRNSTILNVAHAIVERQMAFLQYGDEAMKPMVLKDLAEQLDLHESTISRVTTRKFLHTPKGIYEFKYFFSSHVNTDTGGECSATAIRAMIKKIITSENPRKPYSDNKLTNLLNEQGVNVARRTVAKYREALAIPSSHDRKALS
ncbi:RNA polymerase factor sigma-54 [Leucothrix pacifica]|uniref:RNA polymerase sigma-54 factor n=1 Tax=Leucothrix pacifica TaxID=1247513 RepID=A0A317C8G5_9GAMM|nr:RNA polymerase factor sigma-54 [Leucothrix pacifica]PWQ94955.1 RNA polymerase factor sigma-54 [Leucothrix pacifica]